MTPSALLSLRVLVDTGAAGQTEILPQPITSATTVNSILTFPIITGNNTLAVPPGTTVVLIILPSDGTTALILRGTTLADVGIPIGPTGWSAIPIDSTATPSLILSNAGSTLPGVVIAFL